MPVGPGSGRRARRPSRDAEPGVQPAGRALIFTSMATAGGNEHWRSQMAHSQTRELDEMTGHAVALMTLYVGATELGATELDEASAGGLLDELLAAPGGPRRTAEALETLCGALLALFEWETGTSPSTVLQQLGTMVALAAD